MIRMHRAYDGPSAHRPAFLVDRVWPRGVHKDELRLDGWFREVAPSTELRRWFGHRFERWTGFRERYLAELDAHPDVAAPLLDAATSGSVTLIYGARDIQHNNAVVLAEWLQTRLSG
jgi:uncharacterized protein YeaO (DUF488 family)